MKKSKILFAALAALTVSPNVMPLVLNSNQVLHAVEQGQAQSLMALGASLNQQQMQDTIQLLGASQVAANNTITVDGNMINKYLQIGADSSVDVYSSVYVEAQAPGSGVQVQIVTPQNITLVSNTTYQNAAITAGAKDALVRVASTIPVTGEGALTGLYALLEKQGVKVNQNDVKVAQTEITIVDKIKQDTGLTDDQVNKIMAEIKKAVAKKVQAGETVDGQAIVKAVLESMNLQVSDDAFKILVQFANDFAKTQAAANKETENQIDQSINDPDWASVLANAKATMSVEDIKSIGKPDFSDTQKYHAILPAMYDKFFEYVAEGKRIDDLYSHTFILEVMDSNLPVETKAALDQLRELMYQYTAAIFEADVKDEWMNKLQAIDSIRKDNPALAEIIQETAIKTGYAPEAYTYENFQQVDNLISFDVADSTPDKDTVLAHFQYDVSNGELFIMDVTSGEYVPLSQFDLGALYNVQVDNNYAPKVIVPADFKLANATESDESSQEENSQEAESAVSDESQAGSNEGQMSEESAVENSLDQPTANQTPEEAGNTNNEVSE